MASSRLASCLAVGMMMVAWGCHDDSEDHAGCPVVDEAFETGDELFSITEATVAFSVNDNSSGGLLEGGEAVVRVLETDGNGEATRASVRRLRLQFGDLEIDTTEGKVDVSSPEIAFEAPFEVVNEGSGYVLPSDLAVQTCADVDGSLQHAGGDLVASDEWHSNDIQAFFTDPKSFLLNARLNLVVYATNEDSSRIEIVADVQASGTAQD